MVVGFCNLGCIGTDPNGIPSLIVRDVIAVAFYPLLLEVALILIGWSFPTQVGIYFHLQHYLFRCRILVGVLYSMLFAQTKSIGSTPMLYGDTGFLLPVFTSVFSIGSFVYLLKTVCLGL